MLAEEISSEILAAYASGVTIPPVRHRVVGIEAAYAVQRSTVRTWLACGRTLAGRKIGLTSIPVQTQLGVDQPDFGALFTDMIVADGGEVAMGRVLQPRVEAEIAFFLKHDLAGEKITQQQVADATDHVSPALEICGSRITGWDIRIEDTVADNASAGLVVIGAAREMSNLDALAQVPMSLQRNGETVVTGRGEACLGNPTKAVAWLAETLTRFGDTLRAGDLVMSGALGRMVAAAPGDRFAASFGDLGGVSVRFAG